MFIKFLIVLKFGVFIVHSIEFDTILECEDYNDDGHCIMSHIQGDPLNPNLYFNDWSQETILNSITHLTFQESNLYQLPEDLFNTLTELHYLFAENCSINKISRAEFKNANHLQELWLQKNNIKVLEHMVFWDASRLLELNLASNQIEKIQETAFYNLNLLVELDLSENQIQDINGEMFRDLRSLKVVSLANNKISRLDSNLFENNMLLEVIWLNGNKITTVGEHFLMTQIKIEYLHLQNNSIETLNFKSIQAKTVNLNNNNLTTLQINSKCYEIFANNNKISNFTVENDVTITHLYIANNRVADLSTISTLSSLQYLDLANNSIGPLNLTTFSVLKSLLSLNLSHTNISNLEYGTFSHQPDLKKLDISYNLLKEVNLHIFTSLSSLEELVLDGNNLTEIRIEDIKHILPNIQKISLSDNKWNCTYLTALIIKLNREQVRIKVDPTKFVQNSTNQKGIRCSDNKSEEQRQWHQPVVQDLATNDNLTVQEMSKPFDKLIINTNTTNVEDLRVDMNQLKERLQIIEKKLTEHGMALVQLQNATSNITTQPNIADGFWIRNLVDELKNYTLQRQQVDNDVLSQKLHEMAYKVDRLETMMKAKYNNEDTYQFHSRIQTKEVNTTSNDKGHANVLTILLLVILTVSLVFCGFKATTHYVTYRRLRQQSSSFFNQTSSVIEQSV